MLFLVISEPRPEPPSAVAAARRRYWPWVRARAGRGAVVLFDVDGNETLHRLLNEWADIIPARFDVYPLIDPEAAGRFLGAPRKPSARSRSGSSTGRAGGGRGRAKPIASS